MCTYIKTSVLNVTKEIFCDMLINASNYTDTK